MSTVGSTSGKQAEASRKTMTPPDRMKGVETVNDSDSDSDDEGSGYGTKPEKPEYYYGDRTKLENWLLSCDMYFVLQKKPVPDKKKVLLASSYLRDKPKTWIRNSLILYLNGQADVETKEWLEDWDNFKARMRTNFGLANEKEYAVSAIQRFRQTKSASEYTTVFQHYATLTG